MLTELVVEGLGVIERAELDLGPGSSALTGETGAGKTLLVAAVGLLLGQRGDRALVRSGTNEARVEARFIVPAGHPAVALLDEEQVPRAVDTGEVEIVLARTMSSDGRSKARLNGRMATAATLAEIGPLLVEVAGQNEHLRIAAPAVQRNLLDAYCGEEAIALASEVSERVRAAHRAATRHDELARTHAARAAEAESLRAEITEIEAAAPTPGETASLSADASRLEHAEEIAAGVAEALEAVRGERGVEELLDSAVRSLMRTERVDAGLSELRGRLDAARFEVADVAAELSRRAPSVEPDALERIRERQAVLSRLRRRYGDTESEILAHAAAARGRLEDLEGAGSTTQLWARERDEQRAGAEAAAKRLSEMRATGAARLEKEVEATLRELALADARFEIALEARPLFEGGAESVEFRVALNQGEPPKPLGKVASGGELARIALALHLAAVAGAPATLIFDEVDAGIGGEAAQAVGRCLAELARRTGSQVLVVTHLPQVAVFADNHFKVTKASRGGRSSAAVARVEGELRVTELSRMLAGLPQSDTARSHAQELLELATAK